LQCIGPGQSSYGSVLVPIDSVLLCHLRAMKRKREARQGTPKASEETERSGGPERALDVTELLRETKLEQAGPWVGLYAYWVGPEQV
jgi:hypothetical protein